MSWPVVKLGDIFDVSSSKRVHKKDWRTEGVPFYRAREVVALARDGIVENELFIDEEMYEEYKEKYGVPQEDDVLVTAVGTLGQTYAVKKTDRFYFKDASVILLRKKVEVDIPYILHVLNSVDVQRDIKKSDGATVGTYTISRAKETEIPLPPLAEQKRIAAILDKADAIRRKRQQAIQLADEFLRSVFLDMFGDPITNPKGLSVKKLSELCLKITDGTHHSPPIVDEGVPYVTAKHLKKDGLRFQDNPWYVSEESHQEIFARCAPEKHDVLYIKDGATTGLAAINYYDFEFSMLSSLALLKPNRDILTPEYLCMFLNHPRTKLVLTANMAGAAITRLTLAKIKDVDVPCPSIAEQQKFSEIYNKVKGFKDKVSNSGFDLDQNFNSLSQKAFSGQL